MNVGLRRGDPLSPKCQSKKNNCNFGTSLKKKKGITGHWSKRKGNVYNLCGI
jgi:hypothetical protein